MATQPAPILAATQGPLAAHWWVPLLRGIIALIFGIVLFVLPLSSVAAFVLLFGAYAAVDGVLGIVQALRFAHPSTGRWWLQLLAGVALALDTLGHLCPQVLDSPGELVT